MSFTMKKTMLCLALTGLTMPVHAAVSDEKGSGPTGWTGEAEVAVLLTEGNSESLTQLFRSEVTRDSLNWRHSLDLEGANTSVTEEDTGLESRTVERYYGAYKIDRKLGDEKANYLFNIVTYEKDAFSGYQYRASYALGFGRQWTNTERQTLETEVGPGYRVQCLEPETGYAHCDDKEESATLRAAVRYRLALTENATFREQISTEVAENETISRVETSLTSLIYERFAMRVTHLLKHNTNPAEGNEKADQEITLSLVYSF